MRSSFRFSLSIATLSFAALVAIGCGAKTTEPTHDTPTTESGVTGQNPCANKACGVDCTPEGSDEPFNCNSAGKCVATGEALGCKQCPAFLGDCPAGTAPADSNGDGCIDSCKAVANGCSGKVCGQDCSPPGSDEPFNCNSAGRCVATGASLGCEPYPSPACHQKVCGADCTPEGSDEPFNCASNGWCVAAGQPLGCK